MGKLISGPQSLPRSYQLLVASGGRENSPLKVQLLKVPNALVNGHISRHVWAVLLTVLNSLVLRDMRLGGGLGDDFTEVRRKNWGEKVCMIMYEIPKELKLGYFFFKQLFHILYYPICCHLLRFLKGKCRSYVCYVLPNDNSSALSGGKSTAMDFLQGWGRGGVKDP